MKMHMYLSFKGDCEAAFKFYERTLGGQPGAIFRYAGSPMEQTVPAGFREKVMHGSMTIGEQVLMGADVMPEQYDGPKCFALSLHTRNAEEAERVFESLAQGGTVVFPLAKTFWTERFGMVNDRFGIPWMINCEQSA
jgi:PhnB protein